VVIGGLIVATIMTLYVLPAISHLILRKRGEPHHPGDFEDGIPGSEPLPA
jgi:cobalt-zinc-cadmium resistance protein CzcA